MNKFTLGIIVLVLLLMFADGVKPKARRGKKQSVAQIDCDIRAGKIKVPEFIAKCSPGCLSTKQAVWGTDVYASVSSVCGAAIHSGIIDNNGGKIHVRKVPSKPNYRGSFSNGIRSLSLPRWKESFVVSEPKQQKGVTYPSIHEFLPSRKSTVRTERLKPTAAPATTRAPVITTKTPTTRVPTTTKAPTTTPKPTSTTQHPTPSQPLLYELREVGYSDRIPNAASLKLPAISSQSHSLYGKGQHPGFRGAAVTEFTNRNYPRVNAGIRRQNPGVPFRSPARSPVNPGFTQPKQISGQRPEWPGLQSRQKDSGGIATDSAYTWTEVETYQNPAYSARPLSSDYDKWIHSLGGSNHRPQDPNLWRLQAESMDRNHNTDETDTGFWNSDLQPFNIRGFNTGDGDLGHIIEDPASQGDPNCKIDIAFLLDGSWSIGKRRFKIQKKFLLDFVQELNVGVAGPLMGIIQYGDNATTEFNLKTYRNSNFLKRAIGKIPQKGGLSNVGRALTHTSQHFFSNGNGNRGAAPNVIVILVDGWPTDKVEEASRLARESGINIFFITIEGPVDNEMNSVVEPNFVDKSVCRTNGYFSINVPSWFKLHQVVRPLVKRVCTTNRLVCSKTCLNSADIGFVIDGSSSVGTDNFRTVLQFVANMTKEFEISDTDTRIGALQYTYEQRLEFGFGEHNTKEEVIRAIKNIRYWSGGTSTGAAISYASEQLFSKSKPNKRKLMIVITDGRSYDDVRTPALAAQRNGVIAYAIGIAWAAVDELEYIATDPDKDHSFFVDEFDNLYKFVSQIVQNICQEFNSQPRN
ncbi:vitrin [Callorhinchus milii]|uniref:Cochlin n=1 Tax=Callorhinchus milii TaxID=7868 RepID=A0A4W3GM16_CALMI|nr:vitrin [Callorhinchus milii]|eukprot:gi/632933654/ref/XP_007889508.1/ PREDICTED: vitrin [Callorhinchus milii]